MRNISSYLSMLVMLIICSTTLVACGGSDDDQDEPEILSVNPSSISLISNANSSASFVITASGDWTISGGDEWLNISSTSGKGNTSIIVTALSDNSSATNRTCVLTVSGNGGSVTVNVSQLAGLQSGCEVLVTDEVILADSFAQRLKFGPNVSFFYAGYLSSSSAGWTDDRIVRELQSMDDASDAEDGIVMSADGLYEDTQYYQYFVGFDEKGNRGELLRRAVRTPSSRNAPAAYISDVTYSSTEWNWSTTISPTANEYYMVGTDDDAAFFYYAYVPAEIGMLILDNLADYTSYVQSGDWEMPKEYNSIYIATWAKKGNEWSPVVTEFYGEIDTDSSSPKINYAKNIEDRTPSITIRRPEEYEKIRQNIKIKRL